ncbi:unnamed protein product, partial [Scytosiphon promiscuus]
RQFKRSNGADVTSNKRAVQRLRKQCELAKRTLSTQTQVRTAPYDSVVQPV